MIDTATAERFLRDANPIRDLDDVDPDELTHAVSAVHTKRTAIMQAPTQRPTPASPVTPSPQRQKAWAFAAAFMLVVVVVGAAALVLRYGPGPIADEHILPDIEAHAIPAVESLQWSRVPEDSMAFRPMADDTINSVTAGGPGFVAVGESGDRAAVWLSSDGTTWSLLPVDKATPEADGASWMADVVVGGPGLVAVGS